MESQDITSNQRFNFHLLVMVLVVSAFMLLLMLAFQPSGRAGELVRIEVTPDHATVDHGETCQFTATGYDEEENEVPIDPVWSVPPEVGEVTQEGLFTGTGWGTGEVEARVGDIFGTATVQVPTYVSGTITEDTTWIPEYNPYVINNTKLTIEAEATLTVEAGTVVKMQDSVEPPFVGTIQVYGVLNAQGTSEDEVYFASLKDDSIWGDTNNDGGATQPYESDWRGIELYGTSPSNLTYSDISYAGHPYSNWGDRWPCLARLRVTDTRY